jgi:hypothetical protein
LRYVDGILSTPYLVLHAPSRVLTSAPHPPRPVSSLLRGIFPQSQVSRHATAPFPTLIRPNVLTSCLIMRIHIYVGSHCVRLDDPTPRLQPIAPSLPHESNSPAFCPMSPRRHACDSASAARAGRAELWDFERKRGAPWPSRQYPRGDLPETTKKAGPALSRTRRFRA